MGGAHSERPEQTEDEMPETTAEWVELNAEVLNSFKEPAHSVAPEAMSAAAAHVDREYGYGYRIGLAVADFSGGGLFVVRATDGSRFRLYADRWGNVTRVPDEATS